MADNMPTVEEVRQLDDFLSERGGIANHWTFTAILRSYERLLEEAKDRKTDLDFGKDIEPPEGFQVISTNAKADSRWFQLAPKTAHRVEVDFHTFERWKGRIVKVVYPAVIHSVSIGWNWYKGAWQESLSVRILLLNPSTNQPFSRTNIKGEALEVRDLDDVVGAEKLIEDIRRRTKPTTRIEYTIHEIPLEES